jgi:hypothetical protein
MLHEKKPIMKIHNSERNQEIHGSPKMYINITIHKNVK